MCQNNMKKINMSETQQTEGTTWDKKWEVGKGQNKNLEANFKAITGAQESEDGGSYNNYRDEYEKDDVDIFGRYSRGKTDRTYWQAKRGNKRKERFKFSA